MIKSFKTAKDIIKDVTSLTGADFVSGQFTLLDESVTTSRLYKTLLLKAVDTVLQNYFDLGGNSPLQLQEAILIPRIKEGSNKHGKTFMLPEDCYRILTDKVMSTNYTILRKEASLVNYLLADDHCFYEDISSIRAKNCGEQIVVFYLSKAVFADSEFGDNKSVALENDNQYIMLDSYLLTYCIAKDYCSTQSLAISNIQYYASEYQNRLNYLISEANTDNSFVFDLNTNSMRRARA